MRRVLVAAVFIARPCMVGLVVSIVACAPTVTVPPGTALFKCNYSDAECRRQAAAACPEGNFHVVSESTHAGGALADALPGPVTWYDLIAACGEDPNGFEARRRAIVAGRDSEFVWPVCENPPKPGRCGLEWDKLVRLGTVDRFVHERCQEDDPARPTVACLALMKESFRAALRRTYPRAVESDVANFCDGQPEGCATPVLEEIQWLTSHDARVMNAFKAALERLATDQAKDAERAAIAAQAEADAAERRRATFAAFQAAAAGLQAAGSGLQTSGTQAAGGCTGDVSCQPGFVCLKPPGSVTGTCAQAVNAYGNPEPWRGPRPSSVGVGRAEYSGIMQCPIGFRCTDGHCVR